MRVEDEICKGVYVCPLLTISTLVQARCLGSWAGFCTYEASDGVVSILVLVS